MIKAEWLYDIIAAFFAVIALIRLTDRTDKKRFGSFLYWALVAFAFAYGRYSTKAGGPAFVEGLVVLAIVVLAAFNFPGKTGRESSTPEERAAGARRYGYRLFIPALIIPIVSVFFGSVLNKVHVGHKLLLQDGSATIIGLGVGAILALLAAIALFRVKNPITPFREGDRLVGHIGWAATLPQYLATLGVLFTAAGVGKAVSRITNDILPHNMLFAAVLVYCVGMAVFTMIMGNAFAAFPIMTAAVGWPILVGEFHGHPAPVFAMGMLAGYCGTLVTPMAANFNLVPAALLELKDQYGPIKAQAPTAAIMFVITTVLLYALSF